MDFPRKQVGFFPTPVTELKRLTEKLHGPKIFIKRDDLTGLAFGGNKTRKLEFFIGDALSKGCDTIITGGAEQSNHCRQTAAACAVSGLECHLVLGGSEPEIPQGNLLLDKLLGAHIHWDSKFRKGEMIPQISKELTLQGKKPYPVPYGGSNEIGVLGFVEAIKELKLQLSGMNEKISHVVFASSSGGTHAGLVLGKYLFEQKFDLIGIEIDKAEYEGLSYPDHLLKLTNAGAKFLGIDCAFTKNDFILRNEYLGGGYGVIGDLEKKAIKLLAETEGIIVDPVYTGRAFGALIDLIEKGEFASEDKVLFWHTGGSPSIFSYAEDLL
ncbi:MAG: D-cysteine desulfhydrase family protein [Ignavibacteriae bacterium HGW-Ignavibacteriae-3]|nr:MAG: D-cysteine desulfhydrase family protein [Ignavibacteriae bacterium HGW-Ignavibacteriae-3]